MSSETYRVNFHTHSTNSDGALSVNSLVNLMEQESVKWVSLTDHDTIDGVADFLSFAKLKNINAISGAEISITIDSTMDCHLLAYDFDCAILSTFFQQRAEQKDILSRDLIDSLIQNGYSKLQNIPHADHFLQSVDVARYLIQAQYVSNMDEAYVKILNQKPYSQYRLPYHRSDFINAIHQARGLAILAHPYDFLNGRHKITLSEEQIIAIVTSLKDQGLDGIEVFYKDYSDRQIAFLHMLADKMQLLKSGGTDFHGKPNRNIPYIELKNDPNTLLNYLLNK